MWQEAERESNTELLASMKRMAKQATAAEAELVAVKAAQELKEQEAAEQAEWVQAAKQQQKQTADSLARLKAECNALRAELTVAQALVKQLQDLNERMVHEKKGMQVLSPSISYH